MSEENNDAMVQNEVAVKGIVEMGHSGATLCFLFAVLSFLFCGSMLGLYGEGTTLVVGIVQLGVFPAYHICAQNLLKQGLAFDGNVFMIFGALFALVGGALNVTGVFLDMAGIAFSSSAQGVVWLLSGILLLLILPGARKSPLVSFILYICGGLGLTIMGLVMIGIAPVEFNMVVGVLFAGAGTCGFLCCLSAMNGFTGINIPLGKPLFK